MNERKRKRSQAWEKRAAVGTRSCLGDWPGTYTRKPMALVTARVTSEANRSCHSFPAKLAYPALGRLRPPLAPGSEKLAGRRWPQSAIRTSITLAFGRAIGIRSSA